jgi:hypothetical protein
MPDLLNVHLVNTTCHEVIVKGGIQIGVQISDRISLIRLICLGSHHVSI